MHLIAAVDHKDDSLLWRAAACSKLEHFGKLAQQLGDARGRLVVANATLAVARELVAQAHERLLEVERVCVGANKVLDDGVVLCLEQFDKL